MLLSLQLWEGVEVHELLRVRERVHTKYVFEGVSNSIGEFTWSAVE